MWWQKMAVELAILAGIISLLTAGVLTFYILRQPLGTPRMIEIYKAIREGSKAYLMRQYKTISIISLILTAVLYFTFGWQTSLAFIIGAFFSLLAGYIGMEVATRSNSRTAYAAEK